MKIVARFDVIWNQTFDKGVPATKIFDVDSTLEDILKWENAITSDKGQYGYTRVSDIRLSIIK